MNNLRTKPNKFKIYVLIGFLGLLFGLGGWAFSSPVGSSPDDDFHLVSVWCGTGVKDQLCEQAPVTKERLVPSGLINANCYAFRSNSTGLCQGDLNASSSLISTDRGSFDSNYPPVYYATHSFFASKNLVLSALSMRLINIFVFMFSVFIIFAYSANRIRSTIYWTLATTMVPLGWFLIASNNPSSWAITGIVTSFFALHGLFQTNGRRFVLFTILYFLEVLISAGARGDAGIYLSIVSISAIVLWMPAQKVKLLIPALGSIVGLLFFLATKQANVASTGLASIAIDVAGRTPIDVLLNNLIKVPALWIGTFGFWPLGWLDTYMPAAVWIISGIVFILCVVFSLKYLSKIQIWLSLGVLLILYALPIYVLQQGLNIVGEQVQPRYLLPLILIFAAIVFYNSRMQEGPFVKKNILNFILIGLISFANSIALLSNINRYVNANGNWKMPLLGKSSWWWSNFPLSPIALWITGSFALFIGLIYLLKALKVDRDN